MQKTSTEVQDKTRLSGTSNPLGIVQEIKISPYNQMFYA